MPTAEAFQGSLFSSDFLTESVAILSDWDGINAGSLETLRADLKAIFDAFPSDQRPNESQTEDDLIWLVLKRLGWTASLRQQDLAARGREDVPDGILFADEAAKSQANHFSEEWKRYAFDQRRR